MWYGTEAFFADQFTCLAADTVGFIFYTDECALKMLYELCLTMSQFAYLFA